MFAHTSVSLPVPPGHHESRRNFAGSLTYRGQTTRARGRRHVSFEGRRPRNDPIGRGMSGRRVRPFASVSRGRTDVFSVCTAVYSESKVFIIRGCACEPSCPGSTRPVAPHRDARCPEQHACFLSLSPACRLSEAVVGMPCGWREIALLQASANLLMSAAAMGNLLMSTTRATSRSRHPASTSTSSS